MNFLPTFFDNGASKIFETSMGFSTLNAKICMRNKLYLKSRAEFLLSVGRLYAKTDEFIVLEDGTNVPSVKAPC